MGPKRNPPRITQKTQLSATFPVGVALTTTWFQAEREFQNMFRYLWVYFRLPSIYSFGIMDMTLSLTSERGKDGLFDITTKLCYNRANPSFLQLLLCSAKATCIVQSKNCNKRWKFTWCLFPLALVISLSESSWGREQGLLLLSSSAAVWFGRLKSKCIAVPYMITYRPSPYSQKHRKKEIALKHLERLIFLAQKVQNELLHLFVIFTLFYLTPM